MDMHRALNLRTETLKMNEEKCAVCGQAIKGRNQERSYRMNDKNKLQKAKSILHIAACRFFKVDLWLSAFFLIGTVGVMERGSIGLVAGIWLLIICLLSFLGGVAALVALGEIG